MEQKRQEEKIADQNPTQNQRAQNNSPVQIKADTKHLILCEGAGDADFLNCYFRVAFHDKLAFLRSLQIMPLDGKDNLRPHLDALKNMDRFDRLKSILITLDADQSPKNVREKIRHALADKGFSSPYYPHRWKQDKSLTIPIKTAYLIFPSLDEKLETGELEDICLQTLSEPDADKIVQEIDLLITSLQEKFQRKFPKKAKSKLYTYFATHDEYIRKMRIKYVADDGGFNWDNPKLELLKNFLLELADSPADN